MTAARWRMRSRLHTAERAFAGYWNGAFVLLRLPANIPGVRTTGRGARGNTEPAHAALRGAGLLAEPAGNQGRCPYER